MSNTVFMLKNVRQIHFHHHKGSAVSAVISHFLFVSTSLAPTKSLMHGAWEMAPWLRIYTVLLEDLSSLILSTAIRQLKRTCNSSFRWSDISGVCRHLHSCVCVRACTHKFKIIKINTNMFFVSLSLYIPNTSRPVQSWNAGIWLLSMYFSAINTAACVTISFLSLDE